MTQSYAATYHVIPKGNNDRIIFHDDSDYRSFCQIIQKYKAKFGFDLYHYTLMNSHAHLIIQPANDDDFPEILKSMLLSYTYYYKGKYGHNGNLWRARSKRFIINSYLYFQECALYIERNPVKAGIVSTPEKYRWSSAAHYIDGVEDPLITPSPIFLALGENDDSRQKDYQNLTRASLERFKEKKEADRYFRRMGKQKSTLK